MQKQIQKGMEIVMTQIRIGRIGSHPTVVHAVEELWKYLKRMDSSLVPDLLSYEQYDPTLTHTLWVGQDAAFASLSSKAVPDSRDDSILIRVREGAGIITGSSPRAVLIAVYRFLTALGCRWVRPGPDGEVIPPRSLSPAALTVETEESASYRHRAVCIEGAVSYEHVYNMIDWLPKVGMNGYYIQFRVPFTFFHRWYDHTGNPTLEKEPLTQEDVHHIHLQLEAEIKKRDLLYHATGHGWTCEPFGLSGDSWDAKTYQLAPEVESKVALVNGKREIWQGITLNTNMCYSQKAVRDAMTDSIVDYCKEHPAIDYLHFWLADGYNNHCECEKCQKLRPADFYVMMLNELDEKMTAAGVDTKVVFLVYVDLLWEPERYTIHNPDRFVLMFAPITRTYTTAFGDFDPDAKVELAPYVRNKLTMPSSVEENVTRLQRWQSQFHGDSFDFDYHLMWDHLKDPGYAQSARILFEDMCNLDKIHINGMLSCQLQRVGLPDCLPMYMMARALWDKYADYDAEVADYFAAAFGADGQKVRQYLEQISQLSTPPYFRRELPAVSPQLAEKFATIPTLVESFRPVVAQALQKAECPSQKASWTYLKYHGEIVSLLADTMAARAVGDNTLAQARFRELEDYVRRAEPALYSVLDVFEFLNVIQGLVDYPEL